MNYRDELFQIGRRSFLLNGALLLTTAASSSWSLAAERRPSCRFGVVTDLHYADKPTAGSRHYRETLGKLDEAAKAFEKEKLNFVAELGDLIDAADTVETEQSYLKTINSEFTAIHSDRHYVLGNHCVDTLTKEEFLGAVGQKKSYYSFDRGDTHFVVLDACYRSDGKPYGRKNFKWTDANIPAEELEWLAADLKSTDRHVIVLAHQRLDVSNNHGVKNNDKVREVFEAAGNVRAVFQGHSHQNDLKEIGGIHYCTLVAMVEGSGAESSGYSIVDVHSNGEIVVQGFRKQDKYQWKAPL